jgi:drug/metabolite transporter (DMT)-like permease
MTASVFLLVLLGAALHATWNAIVKRGTDKLLTTVLVVSSSGALAAVVLPFLPLPAPAAWPFLAASAFVQVLYLAIVAGAYRAADMSLAYPLMRGLAPALVAAFGVLWLGETLSPAAWVGIGLICGGVFGTAFAARGHASRRGVALALANAAVIATYTLIDGVGVRVSGAPVSYTLWLFLLNAIPLLGWSLLFRRRAFFAYLRGGLPIAVVGGLGNLGSYGLALWAMTAAPIALVAALRETSILFGVAIAALLLGERIGRARLVACAMIVLGAVSLRAA